MFYNKDIHNDFEALKKYDIKQVKEETLNTGDLKRAPITSFKGNQGHLQMATTAVETCFSILSMKNSIVTPVKNLVDPCDPDLNFVMEQPKKQEIDIFVKNC